MKVIRRALLFLVLAIVTAVLIQNMVALSTAIPFYFLNAPVVQMPMALWLFLTFGLGFLVCYFFDLRKSFSHKKERKQLLNENNSLKAELTEHRNKFLNETPQAKNEANDEPA